MQKQNRYHLSTLISKMCLPAQFSVHVDVKALAIDSSVLRFFD